MPQDYTDDHDVQYTFVTGIFAVEASAHRSQNEIQKYWTDRPQGYLDGEQVVFN